LEPGDNPFPAELLVGLAFGMVDMKYNWIPEPSSYQENIGITKIYWNKDLETIRHRYQEVKEMLASEEWLKGLESKRNSFMQDIERMEKFEAMRSAALGTVSDLWKSLRAENTPNTGTIGMLRFSPNMCRSWGCVIPPDDSELCNIYCIDIRVLSLHLLTTLVRIGESATGS